MTYQEARENRLKAIEQSLSTYVGRPCKNCGTGEKRVHNSECLKCIKPRDNKKYYLNNKKKCNRTSRNWWFNNKERHKEVNQNAHLIRKYNITTEQYNEMVKQQNGLCYICKQLPNSGQHKKLVVDHDHETNELRMLLCDNCNRVVGFLHEDPYYAEQIMNYISFYAMRKHVKAVA